MHVVVPASLDSRRYCDWQSRRGALPPSPCCATPAAQEKTKHDLAPPSDPEGLLPTRAVALPRKICVQNACQTLSMVSFLCIPITRTNDSDSPVTIRYIVTTHNTIYRYSSCKQDTRISP